MAKGIIEGESTPSTKGSANGSPPHVTATSDEPATKLLIDGPLTQSEVEEVEHLVESLDLKSGLLPIMGLYRLGLDLLSAEQAGRAGQAGISAINGDVVLHKGGLVRRVRVNWSSQPQFVLTDKGRLVAKALLITPAPPSEKIVSWRRFAEDLEAQVNRRREETRRSEATIPVEY